jgi:hypothetical protein
MGTRRLAALLALAALAAAGCSDEDGDPVEGNGYSYSVPNGWNEFSEEAQEDPGADFHGSRPDTAVIGEQRQDFTSNVNVVVQEDSLPGNLTTQAFADANIAGLRTPAQAGLPREVEESIERLDVRGISKPEEIELGGEKAVAWEYRTTNFGSDLRVRQVAAMMDGAGYTVTLTTVPGRFEEGLAALDEVVESWRWE